MSMKRVLVLFAMVLALPCMSFAAPFYANNFETNTTANWTVNGSAGTDTFADFFFDYGTAGIPQAPSGAGRRGLKMYANHTSAVFGGVSASPNGQSFSGNYKV